MSDRTPIEDLAATFGLMGLGEKAPPGALLATVEKIRDWRLNSALSVEVAVMGELARAKWKDAGVGRAAEMWDSTAPPHEERADNGQGKALTLSDPEPWPEEVDGAELLEELVYIYPRYIVLPPGAATANALWTLHAHTHDATAVSPLLTFTSAVKRSGKTTQLILLSALVPRPLPAASITAAALFRTVEAHRPTLLVDEADTFLAENEELRGVLNSGHTRAGAVVVRTAGDDHEARLFSTWSPKAIALIGKLPDTLRDRSIEVHMQRRRKDERVERLRLDRLSDFEPLRRRCARWAVDHMDELREADPEVPNDLHDRAADNWRPLLAIADLVGGVWPDQARKAAKKLSGANGSDDDAGVLLLTDIQAVFQEKGADRLFSEDLVAALVNMEDRPWPEWRRGQPLTKRSMARILERFKIGPDQVRIGLDKKRGYLLESFVDAFARLIPALDPPPEVVQPVQPNSDARNSQFPKRYTSADVPDRKTGGGPTPATDAPDVPDQNPLLWPDAYEEAEREAIRYEHPDPEDQQ